MTVAKAVQRLLLALMAELAARAAMAAKAVPATAATDLAERPMVAACILSEASYRPTAQFPIILQKAARELAETAPEAMAVMVAMAAEAAMALHLD